MLGSHQQLLHVTVLAEAFSLGPWCFAEGPDLDVSSLCPGMDGMVLGAVRRRQVRMWLVTVQSRAGQAFFFLVGKGLRAVPTEESVGQLCPVQAKSLIPRGAGGAGA